LVISGLSALPATAGAINFDLILGDLAFTEQNNDADNIPQQMWGRFTDSEAVHKDASAAGFGRTPVIKSTKFVAARGSLFASATMM
jgi:hypothetical protein